jgi:hypothetical protein
LEILLILVSIIFAFIIGVNIDIFETKKLLTTNYLFKELCKKEDAVYKFEDGVKWYADLKNINEIKKYNENNNQGGEL